MIIIQDTREQTPLRFSDAVQIAPGTLQTGDYSLQGLESLVAVERKNLDDFIGCRQGDNRDRFKSEMERLRAYRYRLVVIEGSYMETHFHRYKSRILPQSIIGSLCSWTARYQVSFMFAGDAQGAAVIVVTITVLR